MKRYGPVAIFVPNNADLPLSRYSRSYNNEVDFSLTILAKSPRTLCISFIWTENSPPPQPKQ